MLMQRPNLIFIQADQLAARFLGCYGCAVQSSPTLDRLAAEGVRFERCYTTFPICLPNRASMLTGRTPGIHGLIGGQTKLLAEMPTYAQVLAEAGYRVGGFGKFHREGTSSPHPRVLDDLGFHESTIVEDDRRGPYLDWIRERHPEYYELALGRLGKCKGHLTPEQEAARERARENVFRPLFRKMQYVHMFPSPFPPQVHDTTFITDQGLRFMENQLAAHPDQPFGSQISYVDPHDPYDPPAPYDTMFSADDMPDPLPAEWREQGPRCLDDFNALNCKVIREQNPRIFKQARAYYHGSIRFMDDQIARVISFLEERGLAENTIVVFTTDHGDMMGDHGFLAKGIIHYDGCVRCPLIVWGGGVMEGVSDHLAGALDFFPTFCDLAGIDPSGLPPLEGKSFAGLCRSGEPEERWDELAIWSNGAQSVVTDDGWRLTRYVHAGEGQMMNLREDPDEQRNLYGRPEWVEKRQELLERLIAASVRPYGIPRYRSLANKPRNGQ